MSKKYTKADIERLAEEIYDACIDHECEDVVIYYNNKRMMLAEDYKWFDYVIVIEENINPHDYFEYAAYQHILSMSFDGSALYDWFDMYCEVEWLDKILAKYGLYCELGNSWNLSVFPSTSDIEDWEYTEYEKPKETEHIHHWKIDEYDERIRSVYNTWLEAVKRIGTYGSCVIGDGINFNLDGEPYFFSTNYNQSDSRDEVIKITEAKLKEIGATDIWYYCGRLD